MDVHRGRFNVTTWDREVPRYRVTRAVHPSPKPRHATEPPFSIIADDNCWQYGTKPLAALETIDTTNWPHGSFVPLNESARRIKAFFFSTREKARMPASPWLRDRINPSLLKEMSDVVG
jgi:hypothetical protein